MQGFNCEFGVPLTYNGEIPGNNNQQWQFSSSSCQITYSQTISDGTNTFYLANTLDYGETIIIFFLTMFFFFGIFKFLFNFFTTRYFRFKKLERKIKM